MGYLNFLSRAYAGKWGVKATTPISEADVKDIKKVFVVNSDYGLSACFMSNSGTKRYIPVSQESSLVEGDEVKPESIVFLTLAKEGESDIYRLDGEAKTV